MNTRFVPVKDKAEEWGLTVRRVQMFCKDGEIPEARKVNGQWVVPEDTKRPSDDGSDNSDITIVKSKRRRSENVNSRFISLMSHDIRDSLNTILGYSDMIRNRLDDKAAVNGYLDNIQGAGRSMLNLTNNVMELINVSSSEVQSFEDEINLESLISKLCEAEDLDAKRKDITIFKNINITHSTVRLDTAKLERILSNVLDNAVKFSKAKGVVQFNIDEVQSSTQDCAIFRYTVSDHGLGMSDSRLRHIYDSFTRQLTDADGQENLGSGLGMSVVKSLVDYLGGNIEIFSQEDLGTKVVITLEHKLADKENAKISNTELESLKGKRVLLAEDDELNREIETEILSMAGFEVESAEDGILCIAQLEKSSPNYYDFILMDLQMPNMDGVSATKYIRKLKDKAKSSIPIIAMTAAVAAEDREDALDAGMNGFIEKPIEINSLVREIGQILC
ncbi:MAG: response regulator [Sphaerochaetaceae bacterium]|nr:response regulator [Sphaerochaetaceae bacterium]